MNLDLAATFRSVAADLLIQFGRPVTHTNADDDEAVIQAVIEQETAPVGDYGERMESRMTATINKISGATVGDTLTVPADLAADDPVIWKLSQLIDDDGFVQRYALRAVIE